MSEDLETPSVRRLMVTLALTLVAAAIVLVVVVLPAEYQIDPTGIGAVLGLDQLRAGGGQSSEFLNPAPPGHAVSHDQPFKSEELEIAMAPREEMELKIAMSEGDTLVFSWQVDQGVIYSDFHAEPYGEPPGEAIRYQEGDGVSSAHGTLNAPFSGHHGWYWVNPSDSPATIKLRVNGFYSVVKERRR